MSTLVREFAYYLHSIGYHKTNLPPMKYLIFFFMTVSVSHCVFAQEVRLPPPVSMPALVPQQIVTVTLNQPALSVKSIRLDPSLRPTSAISANNGVVSQSFKAAEAVPSQPAIVYVVDQNDDRHSIGAAVITIAPPPPEGEGDLPDHHDSDSGNAPPDSIDSAKHTSDGNLAGGIHDSLSATNDSVHNEPSGNSRWWWLLFASVGFVGGMSVSRRRKH
jgi:hypothetical protein